MKRYFADLKENMKGMDRKEAASYIKSYYWYHILCGICAAVLLVFGVFHFTVLAKVRPVFTCVMVNQEIDSARDRKLADAFSQNLGISEGEIVIDSDYVFSYGDVKLESANESSYEKFFFKWQNEELDAVIIPESFYQYLKEMGGDFYPLDDMETGSFPVYGDGGRKTALILRDGLLLAFPDNGKHKTICEKFIKYMNKESLCNGCETKV